MKQIYKYMMLPLVGLMTACADKGPFEVGEYNVNVEVTKLTATSALVKVSAPQGDKQLIKGFDNFYMVPQTGDHHYFEPLPGTTNGDDWYTEATYFVNNLKPSTKYDLGLRVETQDDYDHNYDTRTSITTLAEGDYKAIGLTPTYKIEYYYNEATVTVTLPEGFSTPSHSLYLEYTQATGTPQWERTYSNGTSDRVFTSLLGGLEANTTYKLRLHGNIDYQVIPGQSVTLQDIVVNFDNTFTTDALDK